MAESWSAGYGAETRVKLDKFKPRWYQVPILDAIENKGYKRVISIMPRRAGKDITAFNLALRQCLRRPCIVYYIFPTYAQAKKVIWDAIDNDGNRILDYIPAEVIQAKHSQEMKITFVNGSLFQLVGSDNFDRLMGTNPQAVVFSEYALQDPRAYQYIQPILTANNGWALFISTPRGRNSLWTLYNMAKESPYWFVQKLTVHDTQHISLHEIERERAEGTMSDDMIEQEYFCFPAGVPILTPFCVKNIEDIVVNDMVIGHSGCSRRVLKTMKRPYEGTMVEIATYGSYEPLQCTSNHPIRLYDPKTQIFTWKAASEIDKDDFVVFPKRAKWKHAYISYSLCMLMAWYICDGSAFKNGLQFTVAHRKRSRIEELLSVLNLPFTATAQESVVQIVVNDVSIIAFMKSLCGGISYDKNIPLDILGFHASDFFHELMKGDGCLSNHKGYRKYSFTTTSKHLAYQVQFLAHSINEGFSAGITFRKGGSAKFPGERVHKVRDSYSVQIHFEGILSHKSWMRRAKNCVAARVKSITTRPFKGDVYNLHVQYDESYIAAGRAVHNCSFNRGVQGAFYAKYLDRMRANGQVGTVPWEAGFPVHTAWDLGMRDSTSIIFFQHIGQTVRIIDCYENSKEGLEHYIGVLRDKPYQYGIHVAPHDIKVKEFAYGFSRWEKARQLGITFTVAPNIYIADGIEAVRSTLSKVWVDEANCQPVIAMLENYRQEYDAKRHTYMEKPLHDKFSHMADAFRYLCLSLPRTGKGLSPDELDKRYQEAVGGNQQNLPPIFRDDM